MNFPDSLAIHKVILFNVPYRYDYRGDLTESMGIIVPMAAKKVKGFH